MTLNLTSIIAALLTIFYVVLSFNVIRLRRKKKIRFESAGDNELLQAIRAHANFAEYTPIFLILLMLCESQSLKTIYLTILSLAFFLGRISHAYSLLYSESHLNKIFPRQLGMILTFLCLITCSIYLLILFIT